MNKKEVRETEQITITIDSELLCKYMYICEHYGHKFNDQITFTMRNYVYNFELHHGVIDVLKYRLKQKKKKKKTDIK